MTPTLPRLGAAAVALLSSLLATAACGTAPAHTVAATGATADRALHDRLPAAIRTSGVIRVGTDASYAPGDFFGPDGRSVIGFEPDLGAAVGRVLGVRVQFAQHPFTDLIPALRTHRLDLGWSSMTDTAEREKAVDFVTYFTAGTSIVVRRGNPQGVSDLKSLCGKSAAVERGTVQIDLLSRSQNSCAGHRIQVRTFTTNADALVELRTGRVAAVLNDYPPAAYLASSARTRASYQLAADTQYEPGPYGVAVAKDAPQLRDAVKGALEQIMASGEYGRILAHWQVSAGAVQTASVDAANGGG